MGTKRNPGRFDCYANAEPDEPIFVLLGRDAAAGATVREWIANRRLLYPKDADTQELAKWDEAEQCVAAMNSYYNAYAKEKETKRQRQAAITSERRQAMFDLLLALEQKLKKVTRYAGSTQDVIDDLRGQVQSGELK